MPSQDFYPFLKISNTPVLSKFLHDCVDDLIDRKKLSFNNYNSDIEWTPEDYKTARRSIQAFYTQCLMKDNYELVAPDLNETVKEEIKNCFDIRRDEILQALIEDHITQNGHNLVQDYDWKLRWIMGSSKLAFLREAVLQLDLHCIQKEGNDKTIDTVSCEMNLAALDDLINKLESARASV